MNMNDKELLVRIELNEDPVDLTDVEGAKEAIAIDWPKSFTEKARKAINYFDDTAWLFYYKGRYVVTDESLYLTAAGDGKTTAIGFPRWEADSMVEIEAWLETVTDELEEEE